MSDLDHLLDLFRKEQNSELRNFESSFLEKIIEERSLLVGCHSLNDYLAFLRLNKDEMLSFNESLLISYTQFFRSSIIFSLLEQVVFPKILTLKETKSSNRIRIWSAGCSTGQEPYSIAFVLNDLLRKQKMAMNWSIFGTDISSSAVDLASKGEYAYGSLENLRLSCFNNYFTKRGNNYQVNKSIRSHVHFSVYDLMDESYISPPQSIYGDFDMIICCNVLIYYNKTVQAKLIEKFHRSLAEHGCLIVADDETGLLRLSDKFSPALSLSSIFYRR